MAASDKLIPTALTIANNLKGTAYSSGGTYKLPAKKFSKLENPYTDAIQFFASVYAKELKLAGGDATWNQELIDGQNIKNLFSPNRNIHQLTLGTLITTIAENDWEELQIAISQSFNTVYPFEIAGPWSPSEVTSYESLMGTFNGGAAATLQLLGADASDLGTFNQGIDFAEAWNTIKVPYDLTIGVETFYLAPIFKPAGSTNQHYRFTGIRRWFEFNGYDSLP